jgi:hypothetical protein
LLLPTQLNDASGRYPHVWFAPQVRPAQQGAFALQAAPAPPQAGTQATAPVGLWPHTVPAGQQNVFPPLPQSCALEQQTPPRHVPPLQQSALTLHVPPPAGMQLTHVPAALVGLVAQMPLQQGAALLHVLPFGRQQTPLGQPTPAGQQVRLVPLPQTCAFGQQTPLTQVKPEQQGVAASHAAPAPPQAGTQVKPPAGFWLHTDPAGQQKLFPPLPQTCAPGQQAPLTQG